MDEIYQRKHPEVEELEDSEAQNLQEDSAENVAIDRISNIDLLKMLHGLAEPYREVIYLRALGGLSFKEIGEVHGNSENWARVTFYRAKKMLISQKEQDMDAFGRVIVGLIGNLDHVTFIYQSEGAEKTRTITAEGASAFSG